MSGIYEGPGGELLHGDGRPVEYGERWCSFCKQLEGESHLRTCVQHGGHKCTVGGDCMEPPGRKMFGEGVCPICQTTECGYGECGLKVTVEAQRNILLDLTTLHPAAEWTEADGAVLCWHIEFGEIVGDPVVSRPVGAVGSLARAAWEQSLPFWSRRPQVEFPAMTKEAK